MAKISEEPLEESMLPTVLGAAEEGKTFLDLDPAIAPGEVVETIDRYVHQWQQGHRNLSPSGRGSTPSTVIVTGLMVPSSLNSILSMQVTRWSRASTPAGRRW